MTKANTPAQDKRIVVFTDRWNFIGDYHEAKDGKPAYLTDAACIRVWGTDAGLGQIALKGPTKDTRLDPCGILLLDNPSAVLFTIKCAV